jgi:glutamine cyclotransferase
VSNISAITWREQVTFRWDDDDVRFKKYDYSGIGTYLVSIAINRFSIDEKKKFNDKKKCFTNNEMN